jgi:uncharacterized membrane protein YbhN (UPF0104 family)
MGVEVPRLVEEKRISWMNLAMVLGSLIGLWAILAVFSDASGSLSVIEVGLVGGLTAAGIPQSAAVAAALIERAVTAYLPLIWGWATLVWMRQREYI